MEVTNTNWELQNSHGDVKYSIENVVNNIVITMYEDGYYIYQSEHFLSYIISNHWVVHLKLI